MGDYPVGRTLTGEDGSGAFRDAEVHSFETVDGHHSGLVTLSQPFIETEPSTAFFLNPDFGTGMNINAAFSGTPEGIHDGTDQTLYTGSTITGTKFTFNSGDHAHQAIATIVDYSIIDAGETVTINGTVLTAGGTDWTAATSNAATATSLASAIDGVSGVSATATAAVVTVIADNGGDITQLDTSGDAGELTSSALSALTDNAAVNDVMQFAKGGDLTLANFVALSMRIYVDDSWLDNDSVELYAYDTGTASEVGNRVSLEDFFSFGEFDEWHELAIPLSSMGIAEATTVDAFRIEIVQKDGAKSPKFYIDRFQVEQAGMPQIFSLNVTLGERFYVQELVFTYVDALASTLANGTMPALSYDQILGLPALNIGFTIKRTKMGETLFSATIRTLGEHISAGAKPDITWSDGTNTLVVLRADFERELILTGDPDDTLTIQINDDMSGLLQFTASARGALESNLAIVEG